MKANLKFCAKLGNSVEILMNSCEIYFRSSFEWKHIWSFVVGWKFPHGFMRIYVLNLHLNGIKFEVLRNTLLTMS
jgi:hypothetical protein